MQNIKAGQLVTVDYGSAIYPVLKVDFNTVLIDTDKGQREVERSRLHLLPETGDRAGILAKPFIEWRVAQLNKHPHWSEDFKRIHAEIHCLKVWLDDDEHFDGRWWQGEFTVASVQREFARLVPNAYVPLYCLYRVPSDEQSILTTAA